VSAPEITDDLFWGGRLRLRQRARGHRFGHDAALLAAACPSAATMLDAGAGVGAAGLASALSHPSARLTLLEVDPTLAALATENIARNGMEGRARAVVADLLAPASRRAAGIAPESFALVLSNPPYLDAAAARLSPDPGRALAHGLAAAPMGEDALAVWARACLACLAPGGALRLIHRADALGRLLAALQGRAGEIRVAPVRPRPGAAAIRVVVAARKGSRAPMRLEEGVTLLDEAGAPTARARALLEGRERLFA
jgi:tRNA1(Val) A37 N6-methylase TrmN6